MGERCPTETQNLIFPARGMVHYLRRIELPDKTNFYIVRTCERRRYRVTRGRGDRDVRAITRLMMDITSNSYRGPVLPHVIPVTKHSQLANNVAVQLQPPARSVDLSRCED
jgi:hypothetical protein